MKQSHLSGELCVCWFTFISLSASAATIDIGAYDGGFYLSDGSHTASNENYLAGQSGTIEYRNWFAFDLGSVSLQAGEIITGATLSLQNGLSGGDPTETWTVVSVETNVTDVTTGHSAGEAAGIDIFNDLQDGSFYGSTTISTTTSSTAIIDVSFTGVNALSDITSSTGGLFAVGGYVSSIDSSAAEFLFSGSSNQLASVNLSLETTVVPVPSAFWLFGSSLLGLIAIARIKA